MKVGQIEKDIPIWKPSLKYPIGEMEVGDSFFVEAEEGDDLQKMHRQIMPTATKHAKKLGFRVIGRIMKDQNGVRVWRVEKDKS